MGVLKTDSDPCLGTMVPVTIETVDQQNVSFATRATRSGAPEECLRKTFTVPMSEIVTTPSPGAPPPVALKSGASGNLFLTRAGFATKTPDGFAIHGSPAVIFKHPDCAGTPRLLSRLDVVPTSIAIRGYLEGKTELFELDLLGQDAEAAQSVVWNSSDFVDVQLSARGARRLKLGTRATTAKMWPISITVAGSPTFDKAVAGEVDLLDGRMAEGVQHIELLARGAPVWLWVTQDGCSAFHVTPQIVAELSGPAARKTSPCGCAGASRSRMRERASRVARRQARR